MGGRVGRPFLDRVGVGLGRRLLSPVVRRGHDRVELAGRELLLLVDELVLLLDEARDPHRGVGRGFTGIVGARDLLEEDRRGRLDQHADDEADNRPQARIGAGSNRGADRRRGHLRPHLDRLATGLGEEVADGVGHDPGQLRVRPGEARVRARATEVVDHVRSLKRRGAVQEPVGLRPPGVDRLDRRPRVHSRRGRGRDRVRGRPQQPPAGRAEHLLHGLIACSALQCQHGRRADRLRRASWALGCRASVGRVGGTRPLRPLCAHLVTRTGRLVFASDDPGGGRKVGRLHLRKPRSFVWFVVAWSLQCCADRLEVPGAGGVCLLAPTGRALAKGLVQRDSGLELRSWSDLCGRHRDRDEPRLPVEASGRRRRARGGPASSGP